MKKQVVYIVYGEEELETPLKNFMKTHDEYELVLLTCGKFGDLVTDSPEKMRSPFLIACPLLTPFLVEVIRNIDYHDGVFRFIYPQSNSFADINIALATMMEEFLKANPPAPKVPTLAMIFSKVVDGKRMFDIEDDMTIMIDGDRKVVSSAEYEEDDFEERVIWTFRSPKRIIKKVEVKRPPTILIVVDDKRIKDRLLAERGVGLEPGIMVSTSIKDAQDHTSHDALLVIAKDSDFIHSIDINKGRTNDTLKPTNLFLFSISKLNNRPFSISFNNHVRASIKQLREDLRERSIRTGK